MFKKIIVTVVVAFQFVALPAVANGRAGANRRAGENFTENCGDHYISDGELLASEAHTILDQIVAERTQSLAASNGKSVTINRGLLARLEAICIDKKKDRKADQLYLNGILDLVEQFKTELESEAKKSHCLTNSKRR